MRNKKRWNELTGRQKTGVVLLGLIQITLLAVALWDLQQRPDEEVLGDKVVWRAAVFINFIGPLAYFFFGRKQA